MVAIDLDFGWHDTVDTGGIEGSRELEAICIARVKIGGIRGAWGHGVELLSAFSAQLRCALDMQRMRVLGEKREWDAWGYRRLNG